MRSFENIVQDLWILLNAPRKESRYDSSGNLEYLGMHSNSAALTSDGAWVITKFVYTSGNLTSTQQITGVWDNYLTLGWTI